MEALSIEQIKSLYQVSSPDTRNHLMIRLAFEHAMRASEVCSLWVADFDLTTPTVYLRLKRLKGPKETVQPLLPETAILLRKWIVSVYKVHANIAGIVAFAAPKNIRTAMTLRRVRRSIRF